MQVRQSAQKRLRNPRGVVDDVLAIVEEEQGVLSVQRGFDEGERQHFADGHFGHRPGRPGSAGCLGRR